MGGALCVRRQQSADSARSAAAPTESGAEHAQGKSEQEDCTRNDGELTSNRPEKLQSDVQLQVDQRPDVGMQSDNQAVEIGDECRGSVADAEEPEEGFRWLPSNRGLPPPLDPPSRPELFHMAPGAAPSLEISKYTQRGPRLHFIPPRDPLDVPAAPTPDHLSTGTDSNSAKVPGKEERTSNCCCISSPTTT
ncbi:uncharacterized protein LOC133920615 isoform X2 [Phragmites australis]|uniref:uncharacterized protein LOC133920615 isoform X2 n=1 Tax=Phragmites australis TaxID=29695 RepID=UPI002D7714D4|nr:uncharacterized protein LOC133920615 isoform X2 [Phragmites australis]